MKRIPGLRPSGLVIVAIAMALWSIPSIASQAKPAGGAKAKKAEKKTEVIVKKITGEVIIIDLPKGAKIKAFHETSPQTGHGKSVGFGFPTNDPNGKWEKALDEAAAKGKDAEVDYHVDKNGQPIIDNVIPK